jgi:non-canonical poly(A) RNA polymerase PAPD5/7
LVSVFNTGWLLSFCQTINHRKLVQEVYDSGVLQDMLGVPRPQPPPPPPETNNVEKFNISDVYPKEEESDMELSESERHRYESDEDEEEEGESRYRMRSSRQPPAKRRKSDLYEEYVTDDDYE